jgi:hypothetical protein
MNYQSLMPRAYCSSVEVLNLTARLCQDAIDNDIPGDFCEAGVAFGVHGVVMNDVGKGRRDVWLMDSFEGISLHGPEDKEWTDVHGVREESDPRASGGITACSEFQVQHTILSSGQTMDNFHFVKGWFADTLPNLPADLQFSVLRLDCDLYSPYMDCFKYLLPKLSVGGWIILDDWVLSGCKKAIGDSGLFLEDFLVDQWNMAYMKWTWDKKITWEFINKQKHGDHSAHRD